MHSLSDPFFFSDTNNWGGIWRLRFSNEILVQKLLNVLFRLWLQWSRDGCVLLLHWLAILQVNLHYQIKDVTNVFFI